MDNHLISMSAALDTVYEMDISDCNDAEDVIGKIYQAIGNLPTINAAPDAHAKWIPRRPGYVHACSNCGFGVSVSAWFKNKVCIGPRIPHNKFRFCPYCGASMINAKMDEVPDDSGQ